MRVFGNAEIINPSITTPLGMIKFTCRIKGGQYLTYCNGKAYRTDRNFRVLEQVLFSGSCSLIAGQQHIAFACDFEGEEGPEVNMNFFTYGEPFYLDK